MNTVNAIDSHETVTVQMKNNLERDWLLITLLNLDT